MNKIKFKTKLILCIILINFLTLFLSYLYFLNIKVKNDTNNIHQNLVEIAKFISSRKEVQNNLKNHKIDKSLDKEMDFYISNFKDVDIVVITDINGIKYSHLVKEQIGTPFINPVNWDLIKERKGYFSTMKGSVGITTRRFEPIYSEDKKEVLGFVMVGKYNYIIEDMKSHTFLVLTLLFAISLFVSLVLSVYFAGGIKKSLLGLEPEDIGQLQIKEKLILDNLESGLIVLDNENKIIKINSVFYKKFIDFTPEEVVNHCLNYLNDKKAQRFDIVINKKIYHIKLLPIHNETNYYGNMILIKTRDDVDNYAREITGIDQLVEGMRANIHEFKNRLHVILGLINLNKTEMVKKYIMEIQNLNEYDFKKYQNIQNSFIKALLLGKESICKEKKIEFLLDEFSNINIKEKNIFIDDVATILANLIENAIDSFNEYKIENKFIKVGIFQNQNSKLEISVTDNGKNIPNNIIHKLYDYGFSTKGQHRGIGLYLIRQKLKLYEGTIQLIVDDDTKTFKVEVQYEKSYCNRR